MGTKTSCSALLRRRKTTGERIEVVDAAGREKEWSNGITPSLPVGTFGGKMTVGGENSQILPNDQRGRSLDRKIGGEGEKERPLSSW